MAGMAAIGGIGFFIVSSRSMKNTSTEQQGIDPGILLDIKQVHHLVDIKPIEVKHN